MSLNVTKEVALLKQMTVGQLRARYLQVTGESTQAANRKWLVRRIIWRMQSVDEGGLSERAIARARELASGADLRTTAPKQRSMPADADRRTRVLPCGQLGNVNLPLPGTLITRLTTLPESCPHGWGPARRSGGSRRGYLRLFPLQVR